MMAITGAGWCRSPRVTKVAGLAATMPALLSEMMARNSPMPAGMAVRRTAGCS
jgi:hypothetical protein